MGLLHFLKHLQLVLGLLVLLLGSDGEELPKLNVDVRQNLVFILFGSLCDFLNLVGEMSDEVRVRALDGWVLVRNNQVELLDLGFEVVFLLEFLVLLF